MQMVSVIEIRSTDAAVFAESGSHDTIIKRNILHHLLSDIKLSSSGGKIPNEVQCAAFIRRELSATADPEWCHRGIERQG